MVDAWKFPDPDNLAVFTVEDILAGAHPILRVCHDVDDGSWQFLTGADVAPSQAKLVCLADVVSIDVTIEQLADLPLGWQAERAARDAPWRREPNFPTDWNALLLRACAETKDRQERLAREFSLHEWERYDYDQTTASLVFSSAGVPRVSTKIQVVGSWAAQSRTWLWSWDNPSVLPTASEHVHLLQKFGEQHAFDRLSTPCFSAEEADGWEMTCVACFLLGGEGVYRAPDDDGALFMIVRDPRFVSS